MPPSKASCYLVGIDLGTTHTVVASARLDDTTADISLFPVEQSIRPGEVSPRPLFPSVRYQAAAGELTEADRVLPWSRPDDPATADAAVLGEWARDLGAKTPGRLIVSAKSWLSHNGVDRTAPILPWGATGGVPRISPLEAVSSYLLHIREAWNHQHPSDSLENQEVVITVPASFDEAARTLTLEAARLAGLASPRLLEEPQAVCYDWLWRHRAELRQQLDGVRLLLVCDVGGGTTDLTLIRVQPDSSPPQLSRIAVGDHLILGGDNIDLTLAHQLEQHGFGEQQKLSTAEFSQLVEQCRRAKERLLAADAPESVTVTLLGAGSQLIGASRTGLLGRAEVARVALDGFFPLVERQDKPDHRRSGVVEFGLPYARDAAISRHLAEFLLRHQRVAQEAVGSDAIPVPDALLLNGGLFRSATVVERMVELLAHWRDGTPPRLLTNDRPDQAVAYGAVAYGLALRGQAVNRIGGGSARSYFLVVETGAETGRQGICILPRGTPEAQELCVPERNFLLRVGQPVRFNLASSTDDSPFAIGDMVSLEEDRFVLLPPLAVAFSQEETRHPTEYSVRIVATLSETGTLELQCVSVDDADLRWNILFQLRQGQVSLPEHERHARMDTALDRIRLIFGRKTRQFDPRQVKTLRTDLEKLLGTREQWDSHVSRELLAVLLENSANRRRSPEHERLWLSLTGYCLRPGYGYPLDDWRVEQVLALYDQAIQFVNEPQNWSEWWTLWRRIAGGLPEPAQLRIFADIRDFIDPDTARRGNLPGLAKKRSHEDMLRLVGVLERLPVDDKIKLGNWLLQRTGKLNESLQNGWALGRIGSRQPLYGSLHAVVPPAVAGQWLEALLSLDLKKNPEMIASIALIARMTGDRERDIKPELRTRVIERLRAARAPESSLALVTKIRELTEADRKSLFGDSLPPGLKLVS